jgi:uncharacterized Zn finger protein (UPF0148 family)
MNINQALDELVNGPDDQFTPHALMSPDAILRGNFPIGIGGEIANVTVPPPIPSAPPVIQDRPIPVFNPTALTVDAGNSTSDTDDEDIVFGEEEFYIPPNEENQSNAGDIESDTDSDTDDATVILTDAAAEEFLNNTRNLAVARVTDNEIDALIESGRARILEERECTICYNKFGINDIVNTVCKHVYCKNCFFRWLKGNVTCAMCRNNFTSWRRHSKDTINSDITAVTVMFNSTLKEHVRITKLNVILEKDHVRLKCEKDQVIKSLITSRKLIEYNRGYAKGLLSTFRPKYTGDEDFDTGLMKGYDEFKDTIKKDRKKKRSAKNHLYFKPPHGKKGKKEWEHMFVFHGTD